jgi:hypothetical protein
MEIKSSTKGSFKSFCDVPAKVYRVISRSMFFLDVIEMYVIFFQGKHLYHTRDTSFFLTFDAFVATGPNLLGWV